MLQLSRDGRRARGRRLLAATAASALVLLLGSCSAADDWSTPREPGAPVGSLAAGFVDPESPPAPEATIAPEPGSWADVHPPAGYRVALLTADFDPATADLAAGVQEWAEAEGVSLKRVTVESTDAAVTGIVQAMELGPDLIVATGPALVDSLALVSASHLDHQFLVLGGQLPEPTGNVTAAIWPGAASRGSEVADTSDTHAAEAYTAAWAGTAVRAGVAGVLHDLTGIVIELR